MSVRKGTPDQGKKRSRGNDSVERLVKWGKGSILFPGGGGRDT